MTTLVAVVADHQASPAHEQLLRDVTAARGQAEQEAVEEHQEEGYEYEDQEGFQYEDYQPFVSQNIGLDQGNDPPC